MSIGTLLRVLFSLMSFLVIGLLLQPIWGDLRQRTESEVIVRHARAARVIFSALQNLRTERGPTRTTLEAEDPASVNFIAITDALRAKSQTALVAVQQKDIVYFVGLQGKQTAIQTLTPKFNALLLSFKITP